MHSGFKPLRDPLRLYTVGYLYLYLMTGLMMPRERLRKITRRLNVGTELF